MYLLYYEYLLSAGLLAAYLLRRRSQPRHQVVFSRPPPAKCSIHNFECSSVGSPTGWRRAFGLPRPVHTGNPVFA